MTKSKAVEKCITIAEGWKIMSRKINQKLPTVFFYYFSSVPNGIGHTKLLAINEGCELVPNFKLRDFTVKKLRKP